MATIFTRIIEGELPGHFVWRDADCVAFLSINPLRPGHTLVVPRAEVDHWVDLTTETMTSVMDASHAISRAIAQAFGPEKVGLMIAGLEVPHTHVHLVPINEVHDLDFANAAQEIDGEELSRAAERIRAALRELCYPQVSG